MKLNIVYLPTGEITPYLHNPRKNMKAVDIVARSISEYGFLVPIILDKDKIIVAGHTRLKAAIKLGLTEVPTIMAENLTEEQIKGFRIMDNKANEYASWDQSLLLKELEDLKGLGMDLLNTGFSEAELNKLLPDNLEEEIPDPQKPKYDIKLGEIYQLGNHRLMCGDSTNEQMVTQLMNNKLADMVFTDPPYGVSYVGKTQDALTIQNDENTEIFGKSVDFIPIKEGASCYICCPAGNKYIDFMQSFNKRFYQSCTIVWIKNSMVLGHGDYHYQHEPIIYGWDKRAKHKFYGDRTNTTVWNVNRPTVSKLHPTMKPVELIKKAIINSCQSEDIVFDGFGGSGSTLIACEQTNRISYMMELDPKYVSVIIERWENHTNKKAVKL